MTATRAFGRLAGEIKHLGTLSERRPPDPFADIRPGVSRSLERPDFPEWDYTILAWVRLDISG